MLPPFELTHLRYSLNSTPGGGGKGGGEAGGEGVSSWMSRGVNIYSKEKGRETNIGNDESDSMRK